MGVETKTLYTCDRCGHQSEHKDDNRKTESGYILLSYKGGQGVLTAQGDWGGANIEARNLWLCCDCTKALVLFMANGQLVK